MAKETTNKYTDTNAAIYGQLAGAYYGYESIPEEWRKEVYLADELVEISDRLLTMPECPILYTRSRNNTKNINPNGPTKISDLLDDYIKKP